MRKRPLIVLLTVLALFLLLCSCEDSSSRREAPGDVIVFNSNIGVFMNSTEKTLTNVYKTDYFRRDANVFDKELAMLSLPVASPSDRETAMSNIVAMGFDNIQSYWNTDEFPLLCSYIMGHRTVDDYELIVIYLNFVNYDVEWSANLVIGKEGNHYGFEVGAQQVYKALKRYVNQYYSGKNLKLWLTGYSRGGGLSDALAFKILEDIVGDERVLNVEDKDMYAYSFEAPATIANKIEEEDTPTYNCIHSIIVDSDLIAALPPGDYGLKHPGEKKVLNGDPDNLNSLLHKYISPDLSMPVFSNDITELGVHFDNPKAFVDYFLAKLLSPTDVGQQEIYSLFKDRETFHTEVEPRLAYLLQVLMRQRRVGLNALVDFVNKNGAMIVFDRWIAENHDYFYEDLSDILDKISVVYYDAELKNACSLLPSLFNSDMKTLLFALISAIGFDNLDSLVQMKDNAQYTVYSHCPEVFYVLLKEAPENLT